MRRVSLGTFGAYRMPGSSPENQGERMSITLVEIIMIALFVVIIGWDIYLAIDARRGNTISERLRSYDRKFAPVKMIVCFAFGLVAGHWWW